MEFSEIFDNYLDEKAEPRLREFIAPLMKGKSEKEIQEAMENFKEYLFIMNDIAEDLEEERH